MKKLIMMACAALLLIGCIPLDQLEEMNDLNTSGNVTPSNIKELTSNVPIVPKDLIQKYVPKGFSDSEAQKAVVIIADPRKDSLTYDLASTTMRYLEAKGMEVEKRDLYELDFDPVVREEDLMNIVDGNGTADLNVRDEQKLIMKANHIIFITSSWNGDETAMIKGYKEKVFTNTFAYKIENNISQGLLSDKSTYHITEVINVTATSLDDDSDLQRMIDYFRMQDNQLAQRWGTISKGRYINYVNPKNDSKTYKEELELLHTKLIQELDQVYFNE